MNTKYGLSFHFKGEIITFWLIQKKLYLQRLKGGTTAVVILIRGDQLFTAWLGDSQAVLVKDGSATQLVNPHKPDRSVSYITTFFLYKCRFKKSILNKLAGWKGANIEIRRRSYFLGRCLPSQRTAGCFSSNRFVFPPIFFHIAIRIHSHYSFCRRCWIQTLCDGWTGHGISFFGWERGFLDHRLWWTMGHSHHGRSELYCTSVPSPRE